MSNCLECDKAKKKNCMECTEPYESFLTVNDEEGHQQEKFEREMIRLPLYPQQSVRCRRRTVSNLI